MSQPEPSTARLWAGMSAALQANDMPAAVAFLKVLAVRDPAGAALVYDTVMTLRAADRKAGDE